jgi:hypothetical protein
MPKKAIPRGTHPEGIIFLADSKQSACACIIKTFSNDLKTLLRQNLSTICHGISKVENDRRSIYGYKTTITEFLKRYDTKAYETQIGMIGELLSHVLLIHLKVNLTSASPFFNLEENSIKKGFDIVLIEKGNTTYWIAEVKSGELHGTTHPEKIRALIDAAKRDLKGRFASKETHLWHNAINGAKISLENRVDEKRQLVDYLEEFLQISQDGTLPMPNTPNAILVPVLFENTTIEIAHADIVSKHLKISRKSDFPQCCIFAIQKGTISAVVDFLRLEAQP